MMMGYERSSKPVNIFNLGLQEQTTVDELADIVIQEMGLRNVRKRYTRRALGGGSATTRWSTSPSRESRRLGWKPKILPRMR